MKPSTAYFLFLCVLTLVLCWYIYQHNKTKRLQRDDFIRNHVFEQHLLNRCHDLHPQLTQADLFLVARALRQYFLIHNKAPVRTIDMPSKVVDDLWHAFILDTRRYEWFCKRAFGHFFHHIPAGVVTKGRHIQGSMRLTWQLACKEENINVYKPTRLPLLFAIDQKLNIMDGNVYSLEHMEKKFTSDCSGTACASGGDSSGCSGGCGGGCGGGGGD